MNAAYTLTKRASKTAVIYAAAAAFCAVFGLVYESFSHGVYSPYMVWAFAFPLVLGAAPFLIIWGLSEYNRENGRCNLVPCTLAAYTYASGIAALTVGSIMRGVLDIYGTTNKLSNVYWPFGIILTALGIIFYVIQLLLAKKSFQQHK